jgi:flagellar hook-associated protein FlgK
MFQELSQALKQVRDDISVGNLLEVEHVNALMQRIQEAVDDMAARDVEMLHAEVNETIAIVTDRQALIAKELQQIRESRKALKGYDHLRGHTTEQKLSRTA